jgi:hypothetical protein
MNCANCNHPAELHDQQQGCRIATVLRPPNQEPFIIACGCRKAQAPATAGNSNGARALVAAGGVQ